MYIGIHP